MMVRNRKILDFLQSQLYLALSKRIAKGSRLNCGSVITFEGLDPIRSILGVCRLLSRWKFLPDFSLFGELIKERCA